MQRAAAGTVSLTLFLAATWLAGTGFERPPAAGAWSEISPGVWRSSGIPCGYALIEGDAALLIGATRGADLASLRQRGVKRLGGCLLTHHHRDTSAAAAEFVQAGIHVRAPRTSAEWLSPEGVRQYWATSLPQLPPGKTPGLRDGKKCFFTADNFFHADQFSGSGGWSGRNRSWPAAYAASAQTVLDAKPDWVLAEHGGAFEFNAEDFRRRVQWGRAAALAADKLSPGSDHRSDWNPTRISIEPLLRRATQQQALTFTLVIENSKNAPRTLTVELEDRAVALPYKQTFPVAANTTLRHEMRVKLVRALLPGRHVFPLTIREGNVEDPADVFLVIEIPP